MKKIIIAIDGLSGTGKSTTARGVAQQMNYAHIDSGAMYRAITYFLLQNKVDLQDDEKINKYLPQCTIHFSEKGIQLNGKNVSAEIRSMEIDEKVHLISAVPHVRNFLVDAQRKMAKNGGIVMDGRDIGTVVFPDAELKIFLIADIKIRAQRRYTELHKKGVNIKLEKVLANLEERDLYDRTRKMSPLKKDPDAITIDTTHLTIQQQTNIIVQKVKNNPTQPNSKQ